MFGAILGAAGGAGLPHACQMGLSQQPEVAGPGCLLCGGAQVFNVWLV